MYTDSAICWRQWLTDHAQTMPTILRALKCSENTRHHGATLSPWGLRQRSGSSNSLSFCTSQPPVWRQHLSNASKYSCMSRLYSHSSRSRSCPRGLSAPQPRASDIHRDKPTVCTSLRSTLLSAAASISRTNGSPSMSCHAICTSGVSNENASGLIISSDLTRFFTFMSTLTFDSPPGAAPTPNPPPWIPPVFDFDCAAAACSARGRCGGLSTTHSRM